MEYKKTRAAEKKIHPWKRIFSLSAMNEENHGTDKYAEILRNCQH